MSESVTTRVQEILDRAAGRDLVDVAWEHASEPHVVREIYSVLRRREPKLALDALRVRFLEEERYRRDGKVFRREMYETVEALGQTGARWAPYFVAHADIAPFALILGRLGDPRAIPVLASRLEAAKGPLLAAVIDAVGRLKAASCVEPLIDLAHVALPSGERDRTGHRRVVANACLALGRIGDPRAMPALIELVIDTPPDMDSVVARAIVGLGWLGDGQATHALLPLLDGKHRNVSMYALARIADRSSASHVEAAASRLSGPPEQLVYPRLMLEALRSRLGRTVDLDVVRYALTVVMASRFEATELHETALRMMAVHASSEELVPIVRRFVDVEHPRVREAAIGALSAASVFVEPSWLDRPRVEEIFRREAVRGLASALADPDSVFRYNVLRKAAEAECGAELEGPALSTVRSMVAIPHYSEETIVDRYESTFDALEALARFHTRAADAFLVSLLDHTNAMVRACTVEIAKVDVYGASEEVREALRERMRTRGLARPTLPVARLGGGPWIFGPPINALGVDRAGSRFAALGAKKFLLYDADGSVVVGRDDVAGATALCFERNGERLAIAFEGGKVIVLDARSGEPVAEVELSAPPHKVTSAIIAADGRIIVGTRTGRLVKGAEQVTWTRKLDGPVTALVPHPDAPQMLAAVGGCVRWIDERDGSERKSSASGAAIADLALHPGANAVAVARTSGVEVLDATTLERKLRVKIPLARKATFAREGKVLLVANGGKKPGLVRVDLANGKATTIVTGAAIQALVLDPVTSLVLAGGSGVRVDLWDADGRSSSLPIAQHTSAVDCVLADASRGRAFSFGGDGLVLQWDIETREIVAGWRLARKGRVVGAVLGATGRTLVVAWNDAVAALDLVTGSARFERTLPKVRNIARVPGVVWVSCGRGLVAVDETAERVRVVRDSIKTGDLAAIDDQRFAVVQNGRVLVLEPQEGNAVERFSLGRTKALRTSGGFEVGLVVAGADKSLRRFAGSPLELVGSTKLERPPDIVVVDEDSERVALSFGDELIILEPDLRERARVSLEHGVSAMAFAEGGLLVCGGTGGEVSVVETDR